MYTQSSYRGTHYGATSSISAEYDDLVEGQEFFDSYIYYSLGIVRDIVPLVIWVMKPGRADLRPERAIMSPRRADLKPERANLRSERDD